MVLLHGVGMTGAMWSDLVKGLPDYHCLAPDLPGHGASRGLAWRSRADAAGRVARLIEERATDRRAHVVGLSLGASVAIELLATRPDLLDHVIVDGCAALPSRIIGPMKAGVTAVSPLLRYAAVSRFIGKAFGIGSGKALDDFVAQIQSVDATSFHRAFADANDTRISAGLLAAPSPTLFVAGERELKHVRVSNQLLAATMPAARAFMVPGASHGWGPARYPDVHRQMVTAWIEDRPLPVELVPESVALPARLTEGSLSKEALR